MSLKQKQIKKGSKKENKPVRTKYPWQFWCMVTVEITIIVILILWFSLSVKAVVQNIQMMYFENKVEGTVTVAEYEGATTVYNGDGSSTSTKYEHVRFVIEFDSDISGYGQYEYHADNIISSRKYEGQRFLVLFNEINNPTLIQKDDIAIDNVILISFIIFCALVAVFRKNIWFWIKKASEKLESYI